MEKKQAVFLDLNGTIVLPLKQQSLDEMALIPGANIAIEKLLAKGFLCPIITVQARIEKGLFTEEQFRLWFSDFFGKIGLDVKGPYVCPHKYDHPCICEKPNTFLYNQAATDYSIDLRHSYTIGDSPQDVEAAYRFGGIGCLVRTGWASDVKIIEQAKPYAEFIGNSITDAVEWILNRETVKKI